MREAGALERSRRGVPRACHSGGWPLSWKVASRGATAPFSRKEPSHAGVRGSFTRKERCRPAATPLTTKERPKPQPRGHLQGKSAATPLPHHLQGKRGHTPRPRGTYKERELAPRGTSSP